MCVTPRVLVCEGHGPKCVCESEESKVSVRVRVQNAYECHGSKCL